MNLIKIKFPASVRTCRIDIFGRICHKSLPPLLIAQYGNFLNLNHTCDGDRSRHARRSRGAFHVRLSTTRSSSKTTVSRTVDFHIATSALEEHSVFWAFLRSTGKIGAKGMIVISQMVNFASDIAAKPANQNHMSRLTCIRDHSSDDQRTHDNLGLMPLLPLRARWQKNCIRMAPSGLANR